MYRKHHHMTTMPSGGVGGDPLQAARRRSSTSSSSGSAAASAKRLSMTKRSVKSVARKVDTLTTIRISSSPQSKDVQEHRSRLLNRLGIYGRVPPPAPTSTGIGGIGGVSSSRPNSDSSSGVSCGIEKALAMGNSVSSAATAQSQSSQQQRRPSDCSTISCTSFSPDTLGRSSSDDSLSLNNVPSLPAAPASCSYRIHDVPRDPATIRKMNMLRSLGVGGIRSSADHLPRTAVPVCFDSSTGDMGVIVKGASRPQMADILPLEEPLKYEKDDEEEKNPPTPIDDKPSPLEQLFNPIRRLSLSSDTSKSPPTTPPRSTTTTKSTTPTPTNNKNKTKMMKKSIQFAPSVSIIQIPMRTEYSSRIASRLWSSRVEIRDNANRNVMEFSAEDWNWRNVVEDDGMFVCTVSGELVHPVHCQDYYRMASTSSSSSSASAALAADSTSDETELPFQ